MKGKARKAYKLSPKGKAVLDALDAGLSQFAENAEMAAAGLNAMVNGIVERAKQLPK